MKPLSRILIFATALLLVFISQVSLGAVSERENQADQQNIVTIRGKVIDVETGVALVFATVTVSGSNIGIITNIDGEFTLKLGESLLSKDLEISYLGYKNRTVPINTMVDRRNNVIELESAPIPIREVVVKPLDPDFIVENAIYKIGRNYESVPNLMTAFYRETIRRNRSYVSIGEAAVEIFKAPYANDLRYDAARLYKGRKSTDVERMDTVLFKLQGGINNSLDLDIVKNTELTFTIDAMEYYDYSLLSVIEIDGKPHYEIGFVQKPNVEIPLFLGSLYIDMESGAITEAEFGLNLEDEDAATAIFVRRKPIGMRVTPEMVSYRTKFREQDGKWYFSYSRAEVKFKVNWKRKLFNTHYTTMSEMAITDRTDQEVIKFAGKEKLRYSDVFSEEVSDFVDPEFWGDYNVIEPDQSIESAIRRLSRRLKFSDRDDLIN
jgi:hypothetical protein